MTDVPGILRRLTAEFSEREVALLLGTSVARVRAWRDEDAVLHVLREERIEQVGEIILAYCAAAGVDAVRAALDQPSGGEPIVYQVARGMHAAQLNRMLHQRTGTDPGPLPSLERMYRRACGEGPDGDAGVAIGHATVAYRAPGEKLGGAA